MATLITKNSSTASSVPTNAQLVQGELAVNVTDKRLYTENASGTVVELGTNPGSAVTHTAGTAGAPAITTTGDTNTGIFFPAADTVAASVGGTEGLRLTSTGLGVGRTPSAKLDVEGAGVVRGFLTATDAIKLGANTSAPASTDSFIYRPADNTLAFGTASAEKMRLDSSGNLGLGVTPSAWNSTWRASEVQRVGNAVTSNAVNSIGISSNAYFDSVGWKYGANGSANFMAVGNGGGQFAWFTAPSGTAGNAITFTQAMTLDASGNLGLGATSISALGSGYTTQAVQGANGSGFRLYQSTNERGRFYADSSGVFVQSVTSIPLTFFTDSTERARITSGGDLLVGATSRTYSEKLSVYCANQNAATFYISDSNNFTNVIIRHNRASGATSAWMIDFLNSSNLSVGNIQSTGSATSYNTSSDYRLKENVQPMTGALAKVAALKPCTYTWKETGLAGQGFIAHELAEFVPECVSGEKDAVDKNGKPVYQGIDTSFLVATLTAAIQELKAELDSVKAELNALKGI